MIERHVFSASQTSGFRRYRSPAIKPPHNHAFNRAVPAASFGAAGTAG